MIYVAAFGLLFPLISWLTVALSLWTSWREGRHSSPVLIPIIGPACLTVWMVFEEWSYWLIPLVWMLDLGTLAFVVVAPGMFREWWRTSRFTVLRTLHGSQGIESAVLTLHSGGHYLLIKSWNRPPGTLGIVSLGETGTYIELEGGFELTAHFGLRRILRTSTDQNRVLTLVVSEVPTANSNRQNYSLHGWTLSETN